MKRSAVVAAAWAAGLLAALASPASAAQCGNGPDGFDGWLQGFKQEAVQAGMDPRQTPPLASGGSSRRPA